MSLTPEIPRVTYESSGRDNPSLLLFSKSNRPSAPCPLPFGWHDAVGNGTRAALVGWGAFAAVIISSAHLHDSIRAVESDTRHLPKSSWRKLGCMVPNAPFVLGMTCLQHAAAASKLSYNSSCVQLRYVYSGGHMANRAVYLGEVFVCHWLTVVKSCLRGTDRIEDGENIQTREGRIEREREDFVGIEFVDGILRKREGFFMLQNEAYPC